MSDSEKVTKQLRYTVCVEAAFKATVVSPISGDTLTAYSNTIIDVRRKIDAMLFGEATQRGMEVSRTDPKSHAESEQQ